MKMKVSGEGQGKEEVGQSTWAAHTPKQHSEAQGRRSKQAQSPLGESLTLPLLSLRGPVNITLYLSICTV